MESENNNKTRPDPDPTVLTTQALFHEIDGLKELLQNIITADKNLSIEEFKSVATQLNLIERQRVEQKKDTKDAVDAALAAAKEAVKEQTAASEKAIAKSENSTKEILNQISSTFAEANKSIVKAADDLKERVVAIEQQKIGAKEDRTGLYLALGALATLIVIATFFFTKH